MIETYSLNIFKCKLCSEVILAEHKSSNCPFCGAHDDYILRVQEWKENNNIDNLSKISRENLENAMNLEFENARFYKCAMSYSRDVEKKAIFQSLSKTEMEHAFLISKVLKLPKSDLGIQNICFRLDQENIEDALVREKKAKEFYLKAYNEASEERVKEIFFGLLEVEGDHIKLFE